jgi:putative phosphoribosyl transferase
MADRGVSGLMLINKSPRAVDSVRGILRGCFQMLFQNRIDAGQKLARALMKYRARHPVILALPRGGVPVAAEVAAALDAPLDLILVRKVGVPSQPELAMGAVTDGAQPTIVRNSEIIELCGISERQFDAVCKEELTEIERRRARYVGDRARSEVKGQVVIIIDDGIATGATTLAAIQAIRSRNPKELVLAVPVAPLDTVKKLRSEVDALVCLDTPQDFGAIGYFYRDFRQVGDEEVVAILKRFPANRLSRAPDGSPQCRDESG